MLIVLNQYFLVAFPEEIFFRMAFYESFASRLSSPKTLIFLNTLIFLFFHSPNAELLWLLVLSIPAIFLAFAGLKLGNLWALSLLHLALNLCDLWISGDFVRGIA
ncbi:MAG: CPBP family intramembrane metalloprotease [Candidatus Cloacimonetes bacterium]|nr:CPBP family intramembrane metalloprotease [Candidatus Cloacimonadota bacterium]